MQRSAENRWARRKPGLESSLNFLIYRWVSIVSEYLYPHKATAAGESLDSPACFVKGDKLQFLDLICYIYITISITDKSSPSSKKYPQPILHMKHILLCALFGSIVSGLSAQEQQGQIDSIYYNESGTAAQNPAFADYLRIAFYPADSTADKRFRDFYMTGRIRREGCFLQIDTLDDSRSRFDKTNKSYYPSGQLHEEMYYSNGHLEGEYKQYDETGKLRLEAFYLSGNLSGLHKTYQEDGSCRIVEYDSGLPIHDWYLLADQQGNMLKFRSADNSLIWETPAIAERFTDYRDGKPWEVYYKTD